MRSQRLAWIEGVRIFAAVMILLYHAQLLFTDYAFTPQPTGLGANLEQLLTASSALLPAASAAGLLQIVAWGMRWLGILLSLPVWFGYQFVDVFVLVSGFSLVLSLKGKPIQTGPFLKRRLLRLLWPFWTVAWLSYPMLWLLGRWTNTYRPDPWHSFAGLTFPLASDYRGSLLLSTSGPWWFVPLILSFTLLFPLLWRLLQRWGAKNLLLISLGLTLVYRTLATYALGGHPTYAIVDTPAAEQPFQFFLAKLSTFVVGMVVAQAYLRQRGPLFWSQHRALQVGGLLYTLGMVSQFYQPGWVVADLLVPLGLTLLCMVGTRALAQFPPLATAMVWLGSYSYSYFLIHNLVVDRTLNLVVRGDGQLYGLTLPLMVGGTLCLAVFADQLRPLIEQGITRLLQAVDQRLTASRSQRQANRNDLNPQEFDRAV